jgi:hypothetical protein
MGMIWCGIDWAEHHHDVALVDDDGNLVAKRRIGDDAVGFTTLLSLLAQHGATADGERATPIAIETASGLLPAALLAAGFIVYAINRWPPRAIATGTRSAGPRATPAMRSCWPTSCARPQRTRPIPNDSELVRAVRVLARAQQDAVWDRQQAQNKLRSLLREYYPSALETFADLAAPSPGRSCWSRRRPPMRRGAAQLAQQLSLELAGSGASPPSGTHLGRTTRRAAASTATDRTGHG